MYVHVYYYNYKNIQTTDNTLTRKVIEIFIEQLGVSILEMMNRLFVFLKR